MRAVYKHNNWYISVNGDNDHSADYWQKYILPWLAWTPWHQSILGSFDGRALFTTSVEFGWWSWRVRLSFGRRFTQEAKNSDS